MSRVSVKTECTLLPPFTTFDPECWMEDKEARRHLHNNTHPGAVSARQISGTLKRRGCFFPLGIIEHLHPEFPELTALHWTLSTAGELVIAKVSTSFVRSLSGCNCDYYQKCAASSLLHFIPVNQSYSRVRSCILMLTCKHKIVYIFKPKTLLIYSGDHLTGVSIYEY